MIKLNRLRKPLSMGLSLLLAASFIHPVSADNTSSQKIDMKSSLAQIATDKVSNKLSKQFEKDDYVTYLVKMKEQVDTASVSKQAMEKATLEKQTPSATKLSVRTSVVSSLRETASRTQYTLERYLDKALDLGKVKEYKSYFIVNALAVTSTQEVMEEIALLPEVDKILPNEERFLQKAEVNTKDASTEKESSTPKTSVQEPGVSVIQPAVPKGARDEATNAPQPQTENVEWNIDYVNAPEVWERGIDGTGIVVANLDSGVDYTHPALNRKWRGYDASGNIVDPELSWYDPHSGSSLPADGDGHGTHTMGTMVGSEEDGSNQIGVAPGATWIAVRIFNPGTTDAIILDGGQWLIAPVDAEGNLHPELAPDVVNNSWGGGAGLDEWFRPMVQAWRDAQIFPEFSAGNVRPTNPGGPGSVANPANYPESFATGATDINGNLASFSLRGPSPYDEIKPEVSAPGVNIRSSVPGGAYEGGWDGTSMAGPHTTALAALLLQANHSLNVDQLEQIIMETATPRTDSQYPTSPNNGYGHGIINALDAVGSVVEGIGTVSGRVVTAGDDLEEPVLEHTQVSSAFTGIDVPLTARVTDNVGVTAVEAFARTAGTSQYVYLPMNRIAGDSKDGTYTAVIPAFLIESQGLEYYIRVNDYGNNGFESSVYKVEVSDGVQPGYIQDFEENNLGFTAGGTGSAWAWGSPTSGPGGAYSGDKLIATNLEGTYGANSNAYLLAPPIDLTDSPEGGLLTFKHWYDLERNIDWGKVYIAAEENDFAFQEVLSFTGTSGGWVTQYVDLRAYAGQQVFVQFNLTSDASVQKAGWYIDDFEIQAPDDIAPGAPSGLAVSADILGNATLNWTGPDAEDLKSYTVYRSTASGTGYEAIGNTAATTYTDTTTVTGSTYYYTVAAVDYSGNESEKSSEVSIDIVVPEDIYTDHFDGSSDNGWTHSGVKDEWERGVPVSGPGHAFSVPNAWATDLDNTYESGSNYFLVSPVVDLTQVTEATLTFNHWYEIEGGYDYGYVEASSDGGNTWSELGKFSHNTNGKQWTPVFYDLDAWKGNEVQFRFRLTSDNSVVKTGWYIDDFRILGVAPGAVTKDTVEVLHSDKPKPAYDNPWYKISRTDKYEFNQSKQPQPEAGKPGTGEVTPQSLPASATVTVLETGRSVKTDPATGKYSFSHVAGDYTLKAEAYGYYPRTEVVTITDGGSAKANFNLEAIPHGQIEGVVTDERTGEPVSGASIAVLEDPRVGDVRTGEDGRFTLDVLEGTYTLSILAADYYGETVEITVPGNGTAEANVTLKPFIGFPGEIAYDDGIPENARAFVAAGNAWAVRMTPEHEAAQLTGASLRFWNTEWPQPGGTAFQYAVYDVSGENGAPGRLLAGPFDGTALRNDQWTTVEFPEPVVVQGDFYIVYVQTEAGNNAPGLATDESGENALRSWQRVSGAWSQAPAEEGNYMIRAVVRYPVNAPIITSPVNHAYTNEQTVTLTGTSPASGAEIRIYNGEEAAGTTVVENGQFTLNVELTPGTNSLTAEAVVNGKATDRSLPVVVTLDQTAPELTIVTPEEGSHTNTEVVHVTGSALDEFIDTLTVNEQQVQLGEDGSFTHRVLVNEGENTIAVKAKDLAGNESTVTRTVYVDTALPEISNISPAEDVRITAGETVTVSFDSVPNLQASFRIELPLDLSAQGRGEIPLTETESGHYSGTYTTPSSLVLDGGIIVIRVRDAAGNTSETEAGGRLYVSSGQGENPEPPTNQDPVAVIQAPSNAKKKKNVEFDARSSVDEDGEIVSYVWDFGDGSTASKAKVKHKFNNAGTYTVRLTVTDNEGGVNSAVHTIIIQ